MRNQINRNDLKDGDTYYLGTWNMILNGSGDGELFFDKNIDYALEYVCGDIYKVTLEKLEIENYEEKSTEMIRKRRLKK